MLENVSFADIRRMRNAMLNEGVPLQDVNMNTYSKALNSLTASEAFNQGTGNWFSNAVKGFSAGYEDFLDEHAGPVKNALGSAGEKLFSTFGADPVMGRQVGEDTLRATLDFVPLLATASIGGPVGWAGLAATGALGAANAYEKSDSLVEAGIAGAMPFALNPLAKAGSSGAMAATRATLGKTAFGKAVGAVGGTEVPLLASKEMGRVAGSVADRFIAASGAEASMILGTELGGTLVRGVATGEWTNPFTKENILANIFDPINLLGIHELVSPQLVSRRAMTSEELNRFKLAGLESDAGKSSPPPPPTGPISRDAIEARYDELTSYLDRIDDPEERERMRVEIEEARKMAYALLDDSATDISGEDDATLFGAPIKKNPWTTMAVPYGSEPSTFPITRSKGGVDLGTSIDTTSTMGTPAVLDDTAASPITKIEIDPTTGVASHTPITSTDAAVGLIARGKDLVSIEPTSSSDTEHLGDADIEEIGREIPAEGDEVAVPETWDEDMGWLDTAKTKFLGELSEALGKGIENVESLPWWVKPYLSRGQKWFNKHGVKGMKRLKKVVDAKLVEYQQNPERIVETLKDSGLTDDGIARLDRMDDTEPTSLQNTKQIVQDANSVRKQVDAPVVTDADLKQAVQDNLDQGQDLKTATGNAVQAVKTKTFDFVKKGKRDRRTDAQKKVDDELQKIAANDQSPETVQALELLEKSLSDRKNKRNDKLKMAFLRWYAARKTYKNSGQAFRVLENAFKLLKEQTKEEAAQSGEKGGRKKRVITDEDKQLLAWAKDLEKSKEKVDQEAMKLYEKAYRELPDGEFEVVYLTQTLKKWKDLQEAGKLTLSNGTAISKGDEAAELKSLERMLQATVNRRKAAEGQKGLLRVKVKEGSSINKVYHDLQSVQKAVMKLAAKYPNYEFKHRNYKKLKNGEMTYVIGYKPRKDTLQGADMQQVTDVIQQIVALPDDDVDTKQAVKVNSALTADKLRDIAANVVNPAKQPPVRGDGKKHPTKDISAGVSNVMVVDPKGRVLVIKRGEGGVNKQGKYVKNPWSPGRWELPGGNADPGYGSFYTALKELKEETGLSVDEARVELYGNYVGKAIYIVHVTQAEADSVLASGQMPISKELGFAEHTAFTWAPMATTALENLDPTGVVQSKTEKANNLPMSVLTGVSKLAIEAHPAARINNALAKYGFGYEGLLQAAQQGLLGRADRPEYAAVVKTAEQAFEQELSDANISEGDYELLKDMYAELGPKMTPLSKMLTKDVDGVTNAADVSAKVLDNAAGKQPIDVDDFQKTPRPDAAKKSDAQDLKGAGHFRKLLAFGVKDAKESVAPVARRVLDNVVKNLPDVNVTALMVARDVEMQMRHEKALTKEDIKVLEKVLTDLGAKQTHGDVGDEIRFDSQLHEGAAGLAPGDKVVLKEKGWTLFDGTTDMVVKKAVVADAAKKQAAVQPTPAQQAKKPTPAVTPVQAATRKPSFDAKTAVKDVAAVKTKLEEVAKVAKEYSKEDFNTEVSAITSKLTKDGLLDLAQQLNVKVNKSAKKADITQAISLDLRAGRTADAPAVNVKDVDDIRIRKKGNSDKAIDKVTVYYKRNVLDQLMDYIPRLAKEGTSIFHLLARYTARKIQLKTKADVNNYLDNLEKGLNELEAAYNNPTSRDTMMVRLRLDDWALYQFGKQYADVAKIKFPYDGQAKGQYKEGALIGLGVVIKEMRARLNEMKALAGKLEDPKPINMKPTKDVKYAKDPEVPHGNVIDLKTALKEAINNILVKYHGSTRKNVERDLGHIIEYFKGLGEIFAMDVQFMRLHNRAKDHWLYFGEDGRLYIDLETAWTYTQDGTNIAGHLKDRAKMSFKDLSKAARKIEDRKIQKSIASGLLEYLKLHHPEQYQDLLDWMEKNAQSEYLQALAIESQSSALRVALADPGAQAFWDSLPEKDRDKVRMGVVTLDQLIKDTSKDKSTSAKVEVVRAAQHSQQAGTHTLLGGTLTDEVVPLNPKPKESIETKHGSGGEHNTMDTSYVTTGPGENNISYGWGIYLTDVVAVAENYQRQAQNKHGEKKIRAVSGDNRNQGSKYDWTYDPRNPKAFVERQMKDMLRRLTSLEDDFDVLLHHLDTTLGDANAGVDEKVSAVVLKSFITQMKAGNEVSTEQLSKDLKAAGGADKSNNYSFRALANSLDKNPIKVSVSSLYTVDVLIPEQELLRFDLGWDGQTDWVKAQFRKHGINDFGQHPTLQSYYTQVLDPVKRRQEGYKAASLKLLSMGFRGHKFATQLTRSSNNRGYRSDATFNYVIYDNSAMSVRERKTKFWTSGQGVTDIAEIKLKEIKAQAKKVAHSFVKDFGLNADNQVMSAFDFLVELHQRAKRADLGLQVAEAFTGTDTNASTDAVENSHLYKWLDELNPGQLYTLAMLTGVQFNRELPYLRGDELKTLKLKIAKAVLITPMFNPKIEHKLPDLDKSTQTSPELVDSALVSLMVNQLNKPGFWKSLMQNRWAKLFSTFAKVAKQIRDLGDRLRFSYNDGLSTYVKNISKFTDVMERVVLEMRTRHLEGKITPTPAPITPEVAKVLDAAAPDPKSAAPKADDAIITDASGLPMINPSLVAKRKAEQAQFSKMVAPKPQQNQLFDTQADALKDAANTIDDSDSTTDDKIDAGVKAVQTIQDLDSILNDMTNPDVKSRGDKWTTGEEGAGKKKPSQVVFTESDSKSVGEMSLMNDEAGIFGGLTEFYFFNRLLSRKTGTGAGTRILDQLKKAADEAGVPIVNGVNAYGKHSQEETIDWYIARGFEVLDEKNFGRDLLVYWPKGVKTRKDFMGEPPKRSGFYYDKRLPVGPDPNLADRRNGSGWDPKRSLSGDTEEERGTDFSFRILELVAAELQHNPSVQPIIDTLNEREKLTKELAAANETYQAKDKEVKQLTENVGRYEHLILSLKRNPNAVDRDITLKKYKELLDRTTQQLQEAKAEAKILWTRNQDITRNINDLSRNVEEHLLNFSDTVVVNSLRSFSTADLDNLYKTLRYENNNNGVGGWLASVAKYNNNALVRLIETLPKDLVTAPFHNKSYTADSLAESFNTDMPLVDHPAITILARSILQGFKVELANRRDTQSEISRGQDADFQSTEASEWTFAEQDLETYDPTGLNRSQVHISNMLPRKIWTQGAIPKVGQTVVGFADGKWIARVEQVIEHPTAGEIALLHDRKGKFWDKIKGDVRPEAPIVFLRILPIEASFKLYADQTGFPDADATNSDTRSRADFMGDTATDGGGTPSKETFGVSAKIVPTAKELFRSILKEKGFTPEFIASAEKNGTFERVFELIGADKVELAHLMGVKVRGAAGQRETITTGKIQRRVYLTGEELENLTPRQVDEVLAVVIGHELAHMVEYAYDLDMENGTSRLGKDFLKSFDEFKNWTENASVQELELALEISAEMAGEDFRKSTIHAEQKDALKVVNTTDPGQRGKEVRANLLANWAYSHVKAPDSMVYNLMPGPVRKLWHKLTDLARSVYGAIKGTMHVIPAYKARQEMRKRVDKMVSMMNKHADVLKRAQAFEAEAAKLMTMGDYNSLTDVHSHLEKVWPKESTRMEKMSVDEIRKQQESLKDTQEMVKSILDGLRFREHRLITSYEYPNSSYHTIDLDDSNRLRIEIVGTQNGIEFRLELEDGRRPNNNRDILGVQLNDNIPLRTELVPYDGAPVKVMELMHETLNNMPKDATSFFEGKRMPRNDVYDNAATHENEALEELKAKADLEWYNYKGKIWWHGSRVSDTWLVYDDNRLNETQAALHLGNESHSLQFSATPRPFFIKLKNPLRLPDLGDWLPAKIADILKQRGIRTINYQLALAEFLADRPPGVTMATWQTSYTHADKRQVLRKAIVKDMEAAGYDGISYANGAEGAGESVIVFRGTQVKLAKVTKDDKGNIIPLRNRLNPTTDRMDYWSLRKPKEEPLPGSVVPNDDRGRVRQLFDYLITPFDQRVQMVPTLQGINFAMHNFNGGVRAAMKRLTAKITGGVDSRGLPIFSTDGTTAVDLTGALIANPVAAKAQALTKLDYERVRDDRHLNKLASDWMRLEQRHSWNSTNPDGSIETKQGKMLSYNDLKSAKKSLWDAMEALPPKDRNAIVQTVHRLHEAMYQLQFGETEKVVDSGNLALIKSVISTKLPHLWKQAPQLARDVYVGHRQIMSSDPAEVLMGQNTLASVQTVLDPETYGRVAEMSTRLLNEKLALFKTFFENPHFFSEIRIGKYFLRWKNPDGSTDGLGFETLDEARKYERMLLSKPDAERPEMLPMDVVRRGTPHMVQEDKIMQLLKAYEEKNRAYIDTLGLPDDIAIQMKSMHDYSHMFHTELAAHEVLKTGSNRKLTPAASDLDMITTQFAYFNAAMRALHKKVFYNEVAYELSNPEMKDPRVAAHLPDVSKHIENFMTPDTQTGTDIATINAAYFLGMNLSSYLVELAQPAYSFMPELQMQGFSYVKSVKMVAKAQMEVGKYIMKHIPSVAKRIFKDKGVLSTIFSGGDTDAAWSNPDYKDLMAYAVAQDWINLGHAADIVEADLSSNVDLSGIAGRNGQPKTGLARLGLGPVRQWAKAMLKSYQQFTEFNARTALIVGYEVGLSKGMNKQQAIQYAGQFSRVVTYSGGKANRPVALFGGRDQFRTVGQAMYSLQGYTFSTLGMMRRYAETAFAGRNYPGITPAERTAAKKALLTMIATQFVGAGLVGLPFVAAIMRLFEEITGEELEKEMLEGLSELFREDQRSDGGLFADIVMHGAANATLGQILPGAPDIGSRFSIGGVLGVNAYDGYSLPALLGPTSSVIEHVAKGATSLLRDRNAGQAFQDVAPVAWKKMIELMRNGGEFRDRSGGLLVDADTAEKMAYAIGFTPQKVKKLKYAENLQNRHEERLREREIREFDQIADVFEKDPMAARELISKKAMEDPKVKMLKDQGMMQQAQQAYMEVMKAGVDKIAERIEKRVFARDPRRNGTFKSTADQETLINALGMQGKTTEMARLQTRAQVQGAFGMPSVTPQQVSRASIVDEVMRRNPTLSRPQAAMMAEQWLIKNPALRQILSRGQL